MLLSTDTTQIHFDLIRQQRLQCRRMLNNDQHCQTVELTIHQHQHAKQHPAPPVGGKARQSHPLYPKFRVNIKGIGGTNPITEMGMVCWSIEDDQGKPHEIIIPGTDYNPKSPYRLLSPQHWANFSQPIWYHLPNDT